MRPAVLVIRAGKASLESLRKLAVAPHERRTVLGVLRGCAIYARSLDSSRMCQTEKPAEAEWLAMLWQPEALYPAIERFLAREPRRRILFRPSWGNLVPLAEWIRSGRIRFVVFNDRKARSFCGVASFAAALHALARTSFQTGYVVTLAEDAWLIDEGNMVRVPSFAVGDLDDVDVKGAAFFGGFCAAWSKGATVEAALEEGHRAAAACCLARLKMEALPKPDEMDRLTASLSDRTRFLSPMRNTGIVRWHLDPEERSMGSRAQTVKENDPSRVVRVRRSVDGGGGGGVAEARIEANASDHVALNRDGVARVGSRCRWLSR